MHTDIPISHIRQMQQDFFRTGRTLPVENRLEVLNALGRKIESQQEAIIHALNKDLGKPDVEAYLSEIYFLKKEIRYTLRHLKRWARPKRTGNPFYFFPARSEIRREPFGNTLVMSPWNYPFQLALSPLIAAISAGNTVVLKPSEKAPATSSLLSAIVAEVFPAEHATVVPGGRDTAEALLEEPFDFFFFTGGEATGRIVAKQAAKHLSPAVLELGGKSPCIVDSTADLDLAAERIARGKFFNAGQTCMAPDFVAVEDSIRADFSARLESVLRTWYGETHLQDLAGMATKERYDHIISLFSGKCIRIGEDDPLRLRIAPRILPEANWDDPSMKEEIFGPVLPVVPFRNAEDFLLRAGIESSPLSLYIFSRDSGFQKSISDSMRSGSICINDVVKQATNLELPFGGIGTSGMGRYRGKYGFNTFTYSRAVTRRFFVPDLFTSNPPYKNELTRIKRFLK